MCRNTIGSCAARCSHAGPSNGSLPAAPVLLLQLLNATTTFCAPVAGVVKDPVSVA